MEKTQVNTIAYFETRGDATRDKLLLAAVDAFGKYGFEGTTTRMLAESAGVNLQAIPYYFGGKEGLYGATAEYIATAISAHLSDVRDRISARLALVQEQGATIEKSEARLLLGEILQTMAVAFTGKQSEPISRFVLREQLEPTDAFRHIYGKVMKPVAEAFCGLLAVLFNESPTSEHVRLRVLSLLGSVMVFRFSHAAALSLLGWNEYGAHEIEVIRSHANELVASICI
jgi:TetR/AcrR family transcriptional regulator, regulator of cefoperazone and chloramphenicol sensitivity